MFLRGWCTAIKDEGCSSKRLGMIVLIRCFLAARVHTWAADYLYYLWSLSPRLSEWVAALPFAFSAQRCLGWRWTWYVANTHRLPGECSGFDEHWNLHFPPWFAEYLWVLCIDDRTYKLVEFKNEKDDHNHAQLRFDQIGQITVTVNKAVLYMNNNDLWLVIRHQIENDLKWILFHSNIPFINCTDEPN